MVGQHPYLQAVVVLQHRPEISFGGVGFTDEQAVIAKTAIHGSPFGRCPNLFPDMCKQIVNLLLRSCRVAGFDMVIEGSGQRS